MYLALDSPYADRNSSLQTNYKVVIVQKLKLTSAERTFVIGLCETRSVAHVSRIAQYASYFASTNCDIENVKA